MLRLFSAFLLSCLATAAAYSQNEAPATNTLDDAQTVEQIEAFVQGQIGKLRETVKDIESYKNFLKTVGQASLDGSDKILKIAKDDAEREKGYMLKISGLKGLMQMDRFEPPAEGKKSEAREKMDQLLEELSKDTKFARIVNDERFQAFVQSSYLSSRDMDAARFEQFKQEAKNWVNTKPIGFEPTEPLMLIVRMSESPNLSKNDPKFVEKTVQDLIAFVKSDECKISDDSKKAAVTQLEGYCRRCVGANLDLYGKTSDDKDFDWNALRGKYVLVKFTASWCGPCKGEIPGMLKAYEQYHDKGFEIVSVFVWDQLAQVKKTVEEEKLPWLIVSEELTEKAGQPPQGKAYAIQGVPTMLLIDREGKVLSTEIRGNALQTKLAELFDKK